MQPVPGTFDYIDAKVRGLQDNKAQGDAFERLCVTYLKIAPQYRNVIRRLWLWNEWPDRWSADKGCDLVAETKGGDMWAIQCKSDAPTATLKKSALDSFLSETNRKIFSFRLLIATTDKVSANLRETLTSQLIPVGQVLRSDLISAVIIWPTELDSPAHVVDRLDPDDHQRLAIEDVVSGFREHDRGQLIMACGTGKTLTALWIAEELRCRRILILVPSLTLVDQFLGEWAANSKNPFDYLAVCSDLTVGEKQEDHAVESTSELAIPPTTNVRDIRKAFKKKRRRSLVVFCTYHSSDRIKDAHKWTRFSFDLAIADEAHRCSTQSSSGLFSTILDSAKIKAKRRLFMTATPKIFTARVKKRAKELEYELASMDDEDLFGPEFHVLTFDRAIHLGLLANYRVAIIGATDSELKDLATHGVIVRTNYIQHNARILAAQIGLAKAIRKYDLRSLISFHSSIPKARCFTDSTRPDSLPSTIENMSDDFRPDGQIWSTYISHKIPTSKRKQLLQKLGNLPEKTRGVIGNFACLGEGIDVPALDGIAFVDPKQSQIAIVQAVGRAIRKPDKSKAKTATIVIPVFVDDTADEEAALSSSAFRSVWSVLNALRAHDANLGEELDQMRLKHRRQQLGGKPRLPAKIEVDLPTKIKFRDFESAFSIRTVLRTTLAPKLTVETILKWADAHNKINEEYPKMTSGDVVDVPGENWLAIDGALVQGLRGLEGGSTLAKLLDKERDVPNIQDLPSLTESQILAWADAYFARFDEWPTSESGEIKDTRGETWLGVDAALRKKGSRGLLGGSSLAQLLKEKRGRRSHMSLPKLSEEQILAWADKFHELHGYWPKAKTLEAVPDAPDEKWVNINAALKGNKRGGLRGLPGGSSLPKLLQEERGVSNPLNKPKLTEAQIIEWARAFHKEAKKLPKQKWPKSTWPTKESGPIKGTDGETWSGVDAALRKGGRGLPGDSNLSELLAPLKT